jgi:peptide/nickel transport system permease protein
MPAPSPEPRPGETYPTDSSLFGGGGSGNLATEITEIADGDVQVLEGLAALDPDQITPDDVVKKRLGWVFWVAVAWFGLVALLALLAPILPLDDYKATSAAIRQPPSPEHWFGTDTLGRDIFSRVIWGARVSLTVGFASVAFGLLIGGTLGVIAGFFKRRTEAFIMWAMDVLLAFPALLLALAIVAFRGPDNRDLSTVIVAIGIVAIPPIARLVRAATLVHSQREYVTASRALGAGNSRLIWKEIMPNVILPVLSFSIIGVAVAIVAEGGLAFLGLSVEPPTPTWGGMINDGRQALQTEPYISLIPCAVMFLTVLALNLAGDRVREYLDVKEVGL